MRSVPWVIALVVSFALSGCASLKPKNWGGAGAKAKNPPRGGADRLPPVDPPAPLDPPGFAGRPAGGQVNGVLAGQVIDAYNQGRGETVIQVVATDASPNEQPIEITSNAQGYFTIQNLQAGRRYKLTARTKRNGQLLAGVTVATPPNAVLLVKVSEDFVTPGTLPPPDPPKFPEDLKKHERKPDGKTSAVPGVSGGASPAWTGDTAGRQPQYLHEPDRSQSDRLTPIPIRPEPKAANLGIPHRGDLGDLAPPLRPPVRPEYQTLDDQLAQNRPKTLSVPSPIAVGTKPGDGVTLERPLARTVIDPARPLVSSRPRVPSCTLTGNRLDEFALNDLNGQAYHFRPQPGRLTLLDFWGTWCQPCVQAIPHLANLQRRYGPQGLDVVGIAYEEGTLHEKVERVNFVRQRQSANYRMLLGEGDDCPLLMKLGVRGFPTLVLLDEQGNIVWRAEGLTSENKARLETELRRRLQP